MRTVTIDQDSRLFVSTNCGADGFWGETRMDLRVRVGQDCDVHFTFLDPDALRMLASAIHALLANYRICHPQTKPRRRRLRPHAPVPLNIWPAPE
jgi:hypothetical protein